MIYPAQLAVGVDLPGEEMDLDPSVVVDVPGAGLGVPGLDLDAVQV